jgi:hypothetical protein
VTLQPVAGAAATGVSFRLNGVSNVTITGFSGASSSGGMVVEVAGQGNNSNITFSYNAMTTGGVQVLNNGLANANIDIAHNTFIGFVRSAEADRMNIGSDNACPNGITVEYNHMSGGQSDGIDVGGSSCQTQILHNEIDHIQEQNCNGIHCDGIQDAGGGNGTVIAYNYLHDNSDCFLMDDGTTNYYIHDNVCHTAAGYSSYWMQFGGARNLTFSHNTVTSTVGAQYGNDHYGNPSANISFTNNVFYSEPSLNPGQPVSGSFNESYNLCPSGCGGSNEIVGAPTFAAGSAPSTWAGFQLGSGSLGYKSGSDGLSRGVTDFLTAPGP